MLFLSKNIGPLLVILSIAWQLSGNGMPGKNLCCFADQVGVLADEDAGLDGDDAVIAFPKKDGAGNGPVPPNSFSPNPTFPAASNCFYSGIEDLLDLYVPLTTAVQHYEQHILNAFHRPGFFILYGSFSGYLPADF
jgi:hypothetical protein